VPVPAGAIKLEEELRTNYEDYAHCQVTHKIATNYAQITQFTHKLRKLCTNYAKITHQLRSFRAMIARKLQCYAKITQKITRVCNLRNFQNTHTTLCWSVINVIRAHAAAAPPSFRARPARVVWPTNYRLAAPATCNICYISSALIKISKRY